MLHFLFKHLKRKVPSSKRPTQPIRPSGQNKRSLPSRGFRPQLVALEDRTLLSATHLAVLLPPAAQVGQPTGMEILALDGSNHIVPNYTGTIQITDTDSSTTLNGNPLPATYTFTLANHGGHEFTLDPGAVGTDTITATDTTTSSITGSGTLTVNPVPVATHFAVEALSTNVRVGMATPIEVIALDASNHIVPNYTGTITLHSTDATTSVGGTDLPITYTFTTANHGLHTFLVTPGATGTETITATDTTTSSITGSIVLTVTGAPTATHFAVLSVASTPFGPGSVVAGTPTPLTVVALDASNHILPSYTGTITLSSTDATTSVGGTDLPITYTFTTADHGAHTFLVTPGVAGTETITATDTTTSSITGSVTLTVVAAPVATHFAVLSVASTPFGTGSVVAGTPIPIEVVALSASNQVVQNYTGTITLSSTDTTTSVGGTDLPITYTFTTADHGAHTFLVTPGVAGTETITATDTTTSTITGSVTLTVTAAPVATHFAVLSTTVGPGAVMAGQPTPIVVVALSASNQIVQNYTGTITLSSTDTTTSVGGTALPITYTFTTADHGAHTFLVTPGVAGTETITATDTTTSTITGSLTLTVTAAPVATHFAVLPLLTPTGPAPVVAGVPTPIEVIALNASNQIVPNYTGTITLSSTDATTSVGGTDLPITYTFTTADHGAHSFQVTPGMAGTETITATDTTTSSITGSVTLTVNPAPVATHFAIILATPFAMPGQPISIEVVALSATNQIVPNYTGTITLSSSGMGATLGGVPLPATYTFTVGDHGAHLFQVTFPTPGSWTITATDTSNSTITGSASIYV